MVKKVDKASLYAEIWNTLHNPEDELVSTSADGNDNYVKALSNSQVDKIRACLQELMIRDDYSFALGD